MFYSIIPVTLGFILDFLFGDPVFSLHPIRLMGHLIAFTEKWFRRILPKTPKGERLGGFFLVLMVTSLSTLLPLGLLYLAYHLNPYVGIGLESICCWLLLATKSLKTESMHVYHALKKDGIPAGRKAVSMIVGRDTDSLGETGIIKATVETVAENTSDGSIAPLFYLFLGGAPFGFFYKAVNTMDSMVGYKNESYLHFGRCAARLDDLMNYIPARLSASLMLLASWLTGCDAKNALRIYLRDRHNHTSPNSAHTEAVMAGALQVQLAGDALYFGTLHKKPYIGDPLRPICTEDIPLSTTLLYATALLGFLLFGAAKLALLHFL